jgi:hypothetical protein
VWEKLFTSWQPGSSESSREWLGQDTVPEDMPPLTSSIQLDSISSSFQNSSNNTTSWGQSNQHMSPWRIFNIQKKTTTIMNAVAFNTQKEQQISEIGRPEIIYLTNK